MNTIQIGQFVKQKEGYQSFMLFDFPIKEMFDIPSSISIKATNATHKIGQLDGITYILPDIEFFLHMFLIKDSVDSSYIEGTRATIMDILEFNTIENKQQESDIEEVLRCIKALRYGVERSKTMPISLRLLRETHELLMSDGARISQYASPGEFRTSQNWIGAIGSRIENADFIPPSVNDMNNALDCLEKFIHDKQYNSMMPPIISIGMLHAQFETIHPFLDGNGRLGRFLITLLLHQKHLVEQPVLFLSSYFRNNHQLYYQKLNGYREGQVWEWIDFFLDGVIEISEKCTALSRRIRDLRDEDMNKINQLGKKEAMSFSAVLQKLFETPVVTVPQIMKWTGFSYPGARKVADRLVDNGILVEDKSKKERTYKYARYIELFSV